jgi:hypothetical protein
MADAPALATTTLKRAGPDLQRPHLPEPGSVLCRPCSHVPIATANTPQSGSGRDAFFCPPGRISLVVMKPQDASVGTRVKVRDRHRIEARRGLVGEVVGRYGGEEYIAVDVRFADGRSRSFWPADLEELPAFDYHLDESDPDVVILRLQDGTFVAAFSAMGATREGILEAAKEDYRFCGEYDAFVTNQGGPEWLSISCASATRLRRGRS